MSDILPNTQGTFEVLLPGETEVTTYTDYTQIPQEIDAIVKFQGTLPPAPHSINEHAAIQDFYDDFDEISARANFKAATRIGDADEPHCSGMVRAEGSPNVFVNKIPWSRQGDVNTPHLYPSGDKCLTHAMPITTGSPTVFINGVGAGRVTDSITSCTRVADGSPNVFCGPH